MRRARHLVVCLTSVRCPRQAFRVTAEMRGDAARRSVAGARPSLGSPRKIIGGSSTSFSARNPVGRSCAPRPRSCRMRAGTFGSKRKNVSTYGRSPRKWALGGGAKAQENCSPTSGGTAHIPSPDLDKKRMGMYRIRTAAERMSRNAPTLYRVHRRRTRRRPPPRRSSWGIFPR